MSSLNTNLDDVYYTIDFCQISYEFLHFFFTVKQYCRTMLLLFLILYYVFSCYFHVYYMNFV